MRQSLGQAIKHAGHEVIEADSSDAALNVMQQRPADVVFTDIQMPGKDGRWLTLEVRKRHPRTAVVIVTTVTDLEPTITLQFGVLSYLVKPFNLTTVREALRLAVEWHDGAVKAPPQKADPQAIEKWLDSLDLL